MKCECNTHKGDDHNDLKEVQLRNSGWGKGWSGWEARVFKFCKLCRKIRKGDWRYAKDDDLVVKPRKK